MTSTAKNLKKREGAQRGEGSYREIKPAHIFIILGILTLMMVLLTGLLTGRYV